MGSLFTTKQKAYMALAVTSILWGTTWVASRIAVKGMPGLQVAGIRQLTAGIILVSVFLLKGEKIPSIKQLLLLTGMAILMFVGSNGLATISLKYIPSGLGALIGALYPLCVVIIERIIYKNKKIGFTTFTGLLLGISGIVIVFYDTAFHSRTEGFTWGIIAAFGSMLTWAIATIILVKEKMQMNQYYAIGWQMLISSLILLSIAGISGSHVPISLVPNATWGAIAYLVVAGSIIAFAAFIYSIKHLDPAIAALYAYINPLVAIITGTLLIGEKLTLTILLGSLVTLVGVYLVNQSMRAQKKKNKLSEAS
jgi:drug/metabolite transporter (DMT)-like permease